MKKFEMEMLFAMKSLIDEGRLTHEYSDKDYHGLTFQMDSLESAESMGKKLIAIARVNCPEKGLSVGYELDNGLGERLEVRVRRPWFNDGGAFYSCSRVVWETTDYLWERVVVRIWGDEKSYTIYLEV